MSIDIDAKSSPFISYLNDLIYPASEAELNDLKEDLSSILDHLNPVPDRNPESLTCKVTTSLYSHAQNITENAVDEIMKIKALARHALERVSIQSVYKPVIDEINRILLDNDKSFVLNAMSFGLSNYSSLDQTSVSIKFKSAISNCNVKDIDLKIVDLTSMLLNSKKSMVFFKNQIEPILNQISCGEESNLHKQVVLQSILKSEGYNQSTSDELSEPEVIAVAWLLNTLQIWQSYAGSDPNMMSQDKALGDSFFKSNPPPKLVALIYHRTPIDFSKFTKELEPYREAIARFES